MDEQLSKLESQIAKIDDLATVGSWGPEFQLWERTTSKLVQDLFGEEGSKLFHGQKTVTFSYIDAQYNQKRYLEELNNRKKILEGLMEEYRPTQSGQDKVPENILKELWNKERALKENLLTTAEAESLQKALLEHLEKILPPDSIPGLRFKKIRAERRFQTWWSDNNGYPAENSWEKIQPFLELLEQHEAEKTIKKRLETEGLFVESRSQGEDQHLLIGKKDGESNKAHIIIDGKTGEIRVEDNQQEPTDLTRHIETVLTLSDGKKIKSTREVLEEITE